MRPVGQIARGIGAAIGQQRRRAACSQVGDDRGAAGRGQHGGGVLSHAVWGALRQERGHQDVVQRPPEALLGAEGQCTDPGVQPVGADEQVGLDHGGVGERGAHAGGALGDGLDLDAYLLRQAQDGPDPSPEVARAWRRLLASGGKVPIGRLAGEVGWSHKHLITRFRQQVGVPPKTAARLIRFGAVWRRLATHPAARWDAIAADSGYADQAHLIRDFHQFTGTSPTALLTHPQAQAAVPMPA